MIYALLVIFGLVFGSFAAAQVWRLKDKTLNKKRSECLHCHHVLAWTDLIPIVSWVILRGKCRYCKHRIGWLEPLAEIGLALFFVVSYIFWPGDLTTIIGVSQFIVWLMVGVGLQILFIYDTKWFLLPDKVMLPTGVLAMIFAALGIIQSDAIASSLLSLLLAVVFLPGFYFFLYIVSSKRLIGFGDIKLCLVLALLVLNPYLAVMTLFLANIIGTLVVLPGLVAGKLHRKSRIPFGPMLILGGIISVLVGEQILDNVFMLH